MTTKRAAETAPAPPVDVAWSARLTAVIGRQVRKHRTRLDWTTQALSEKCGTLGHSMSRSNIATLELGRRPSLSVPDWLALAAALGVPPMSLLLPLGTEATVEALPEVRLPTDQALEWITLGFAPELFEGTQIPSVDEDVRRVLVRIDRHRTLISVLRQEAREIQDLEQRSVDWDPSAERLTPEQLQHEVRELHAEMDRTWADLRVHRAHMRGAGQAVPDLPADLAAREHADEAREAAGRTSRRGER